MGYSSQGPKQSDTSEQLSMHTHNSFRTAKGPLYSDKLHLHLGSPRGKAKRQQLQAYRLTAF